MSINIVTVTNDNESRLFALKNLHGYGKTQLFQKDEQMYLLIGANKEKMTSEDIRHLGGLCRKEIRELTINHVIIDLNNLITFYKTFSEKQVVRLWMEGWYSADYQFLTYKKDCKREELKIDFKISSHAQYAAESKVRVSAINTARDLCNEPANKLTPAQYIEQIKKIFKDTDVHIDVIDGKQLEQEQFNAIDAVGRGSKHAPKLAVLTLNRYPKQKKIALVGKGVTFDTGGVNVKTAKDIGEMKMDMGGSAAVVGAMKLLADTNASTNVCAILPLVENVSDGDAFLPSDVITYRNGLSVEVGNTDAEGRLVLADGILHAQQLEAETIIDIATLTGTIGQALGLKVAGIFSNHEEELWQYRELGDQTGDHVWPMPVIDDYKYYLESDTADINNMSSSSFGGAVTAALFLKQFVPEEKKWIHIDMANTVRSWRNKGYYVSGASGFGVRLLTEIVLRESR